MVSVAGGQIIRSTLGHRSAAPCMILASSGTEDFSPFIFQLPATSGRRSVAAIFYPSNQRLAERQKPRQWRLARVAVLCTGLYIPPNRPGIAAAHPDNTKRFHASRYSQSL